ncbi:hypothetical protein KSP40_PGU007448 [Platanthera guangdongensis]|uniref:Uncharacterized protein n=1 Tax=Platanthera guangdongensis TaxID=2320717 RepID=A0ABR2MII8_9ASPA
MAYVDHAFSISDEDIMMESSYVVHNHPPVKEIALAFALLVFGVVGIILRIVRKRGLEVFREGVFLVIC